MHTNTATTVGIVVAVVFGLLIICVLVWALRSRSERRRHLEAEQIRERVDGVSQQLQRREALADETETKARAAQAAADAKVAEAARLQQRAESHRTDLADARQELDDQRAHADSIDPRFKAPAEDEQAEGQRAEGLGDQRGEAEPTDTPHVS